MTKEERIQRFRELEGYISNINDMEYDMVFLGDFINKDEELRKSAEELKASGEKLKSILRRTQVLLSSGGGDETHE